MRAMILDLDGTLIDTVCAHVFTWQRTLQEAGIPWAIAMSGRPPETERDAQELRLSLGELGLVGASP